jgi:hypothetical protein
MIHTLIDETLIEEQLIDDIDEDEDVAVHCPLLFRLEAPAELVPVLQVFWDDKEKISATLATLHRGQLRDLIHWFQNVLQAQGWDQCECEICDSIVEEALAIKMRR